MRIKVMPDYDCHPLWWDDDSGRIGNISPEELGLSEDLATGLEEWAAMYDATLNRNDPARSGVPSDADEAAFHERGKHLAERLGAELGPAADVRYWRDRQRSR